MGKVVWTRPPWPAERCQRCHGASKQDSGLRLDLKSAAVREPVAVRYAWTNSPEANLYNGAGLPAVPFRSDAW